jgi:hypothetical protein
MLGSIKMENVVINSGGEQYSKVVQARKNLVKVAKSTGDFIQGYADALGFFDLSDTNGNITKWYDLKGKAKQGIKMERDAFKADMTEAGYSTGTIDVYWQRVKEASGYQTTGNRVSANLSTDDKTQADLKTIINRIFKAEELGEDCKASEFKGDLMSIFEALGGNVDNLG